MTSYQLCLDARGRAYGVEAYSRTQYGNPGRYKVVGNVLQFYDAGGDGWPRGDRGYRCRFELGEGALSLMLSDCNLAGVWKNGCRRAVVISKPDVLGCPSQIGL